MNEPVSIYVRAGGLLIFMEVWVASSPGINNCSSRKEGVLVDVLSDRLVVPFTCLKDVLHPLFEIAALGCHEPEALLNECFINETMHWLWSMISKEPICEHFQEISIVMN